MQNLFNGKINCKKYLIASVVGVLYVAGFEMLFHGMLLKPIYESTSYLWRKPEECKMWAMLLGQVMLPFIAAYIFTAGYEGKGIGEGARFGCLMGLFLTPGSLAFYG